MVAAEEDRHPALPRHRVRGVMDRLRPAGDLAEVAAALGEPWRHGDRHRLDRVQRAAVGDPVAELAQHPRQPGGAQRLRPHQRAARGGAELQPDAEQRDVAPVQQGRRHGSFRSLQGVEHIVSMIMAFGQCYAETPLTES